jgi:hypothetical protein
VSYRPSCWRQIADAAVEHLEVRVAAERVEGLAAWDAERESPERLHVTDCGEVSVMCL